MDTFLKLLVWGLVSVVVGLVLYMGGIAADYWFRPSFEADATVTGKHYSPASFTTIINSDHTIMIIPNPETWSVSVAFGHENYSLLSSRETYDSVNPGSHVRIAYCRGRLSGHFYVTRIITIYTKPEVLR